MIKISGTSRTRGRFVNRPRVDNLSGPPRLWACASGPVDDGEATASKFANSPGPGDDHAWSRRGDAHGPGEGSRIARKAHPFDAHPAQSCHGCSPTQVREFGAVRLATGAHRRRSIGEFGAVRLATAAHRRRSIGEFGTIRLPPRTPARPGGRLCRPQYWALNRKVFSGLFRVEALVAISEGTVY